MKRVRWKETIRRNRDEFALFSILPLDLKTEIILRLPAKSLVKFIFVSKFWSSIIRSKYFTKMYIARSLTRPRLLFTILRNNMRFFHSYSQEDTSSEKISITPDLGPMDRISPPVHGLICSQIGTNVVIRNLSTDQFVILPRVKTRRKKIYTFFGYDLVNDFYKVLCMTVSLHRKRKSSRAESQEHQVFTLGAKQKWRMIECKHLHEFSSSSSIKSLCMNGVVYYIAYVKNQGQSLISFDLSSEEFDVTKFPEDLKLVSDCELVKYDGKIALTRESCNGTLDLWVLEDGRKQEWSKVSVLIPSWKNLVGSRMLTFKGAISTGELIFAPCDALLNPFFFLYYDPKGNNAKKVMIDGVGKKFSTIEVFLDHVESHVILPKVR